MNTRTRTATTIRSQDGRPVATPSAPARAGAPPVSAALAETATRCCPSQLGVPGGSPESPRPCGPVIAPVRSRSSSCCLAQFFPASVAAIPAPPAKPALTTRLSTDDWIPDSASRCQVSMVAHSLPAGTTLQPYGSHSVRIRSVYAGVPVTPVNVVLYCSVLVPPIVHVNTLSASVPSVAVVVTVPPAVVVANVPLLQMMLAPMVPAVPAVVRMTAVCTRNVPPPRFRLPSDPGPCVRVVPAV